MAAAQLIFVRVSWPRAGAGRGPGDGRDPADQGDRARWVAVRAVVDAVATVLFLVSLFHLPSPTPTAINMTSPLFITVLARCHRRAARSGALARVGVGFLGVLLIIQPQAEASMCKRWSACSRPCCCRCAIC